MVGLVKNNFVTMKLFDAMKQDIERYLMSPGFRDALENHKSNWIPNSKGGEPNCRR